MDFTVTPIGRVCSEVRERKGMPPLGVAACIEILPEYAEGLLKMERHSHIWVLAWLDQAERDLLQVTPRGVSGRGPEGLHGVFAVRSPVRPNPIGLTAARVEGIDGLRLRVDRLDFLDGTPVIDIKPYFVTKDAIHSARGARIGKPVSPEALRDSLRRQALAFHGEACPDIELAVELAAAVYPADDEPEWEVVAPLDRPCLLDALMGITRATPGRGNLTVDPNPGARPVVRCKARLSR